MTNAAYWNTTPVAGPFRNRTESVSSLLHRSQMYLGLEELLPQDYSGMTVLDYGCGPGQDVLRALHLGAEHVYAADIATEVLETIPQRLEWHGFSQSRVTLVPLSENGELKLPQVDHVHSAGVLHHTTAPGDVLTALRRAMNSSGWAMIYSRDSQFYAEKCHNDPQVFAVNVDPGVPIAEAWGDEQFVHMCADAEIAATPLGHYGPGDLMSCFRLEPICES